MNIKKNTDLFFDMYESFRYSNQNINLTKILRTIISAK